MAVGLECDRAVQIPFHQQRPMVGVIPAQEPQLVYTLIVAKPAAIPAGGFVGRRKHIVVLAIQSAQILVDAEFHQRRPLSVIQLSMAFRLVSRNPQVFHDISVPARRGGLIGKRGFDLVDFEFPAPGRYLCRESLVSEPI